MFAVRWEQVKDDFAWDGSPRSLYVLDTQLDEWELFLTVLREAGYPLSYATAGAAAAVPTRAEEALRAEAVVNPRLNVNIDGIDLACDFLHEEQIELYFDPRDVNEELLPALLAFIAGLGDRLLKDVEVTPFKRPEAPFLLYSWQDCRMKLVRGPP